MSELTTCGAIEGLLVRFAAGDAAAKNALVTRAYDSLLAVARKQLRQFPGVRREEETVAILGESYERISNALDDVRPTTARAFFGLASLQIRRVLLDLVRKGNRGSEPRPDVIGGLGGPVDSGAPVPTPGKLDSGYGRSDFEDDLLAALARLPDEEREVVELLFIHGLTQAEAAQILGVHEDTVKRRWARARIKLADLLSAYGGAE